MKKLFGLLCVIMMMSLSVNAQHVKDSAIKTEIVSQVVDKLFDRTSEAITQIAQALKVPAEHVYQVLVKQQIVSAVTELITIIFLLIVGILLWVLPYKDYLRCNAKSTRTYHDDIDNGWWLWCIIPGIVLIFICVLACLTNGDNIVTGILNPEYGAIKEILKVL